MPQPVFQLRIELEGVVPPVWRRLLVPGGVDLLTLHNVFQSAMGWHDAHLHEFTIGTSHYGTPDDESDEELIDGMDVSVAEALAGHQHFTYLYDFGDSWTHAVLVEEVTSPPTEPEHAVCIDGENACPPEDVGGPHGYADFLEAIGDPHHAEHAAVLEWVGGSFDPTGFSRATVNAALQEIG